MLCFKSLKNLVKHQRIFGVKKFIFNLVALSSRHNSTPGAVSCLSTNEALVGSVIDKQEDWSFQPRHGGSHVDWLSAKAVINCLSPNKTLRSCG